MCCPWCCQGEHPRDCAGLERAQHLAGDRPGRREKGDPRRASLVHRELLCEPRCALLGQQACGCRPDWRRKRRCGIALADPRLAAQYPCCRQGQLARNVAPAQGPWRQRECVAVQEHRGRRVHCAQGVQHRRVCRRNHCCGNRALRHARAARLHKQRDHCGTVPRVAAPGHFDCNTEQKGILGPDPALARDPCGIARGPGAVHARGNRGRWAAHSQHAARSDRHGRPHPQDRGHLFGHSVLPVQPVQPCARRCCARVLLCGCGRGQAPRVHGARSARRSERHRHGAQGCDSCAHLRCRCRSLADECALAGARGSPRQQCLDPAVHGCAAELRQGDGEAAHRCLGRGQGPPLRRCCRSHQPHFLGDPLCVPREPSVCRA
eukprot:comp21867_c0_seq1/m.49522 comp21867_c0_seq1/g.49522  ORF comp21867_c0_seq1/g.49522 comp21867_c0_seq1/m.49522 type:complete len:378 (+) comp21867_c0_seq1:1349-2482(+)